MSKIHYFQRYSSVENTVTNNTLQLLARIYDYSASHASKFLSDLTGESIEIGIEITQQGKAKQSVPDGAVIQRSFKVLIESKIDSGPDLDQLLRHAGSFTTEAQKVLILLTKERLPTEQELKWGQEVQRICPGVIFRNVTFEVVCKVIKGLFKDYEYEIAELIEDYIQYCNDAKLFDQSKYLLRIVPCGESLHLNKKYGIYFHPADRGYTKHSYVGIYAGKVVQALWAIDSVFDVEYDGGQLKKVLVEGRSTDDYDEKLIAMIRDAKAECGYPVESGSRFFCGKPYETHYEKVSPGGQQGTRFIDLREVIGSFTDAADVATKLKGKRWE